MPQPGVPGGLSRSSDVVGWPPKELLDQSGSNDFSAYKEIKELKDACAMLRCVILMLILKRQPTINNLLK